MKSHLSHALAETNTHTNSFRCMYCIRNTRYTQNQCEKIKYQNTHFNHKINVLRMHPRHFDWCVALLFVTFSLPLFYTLPEQPLSLSRALLLSLQLSLTLSLSLHSTQCVSFCSVLLFLCTLFNAFVITIAFVSGSLSFILSLFFLSRNFILFFALTTR